MITSNWTVGKRPRFVKAQVQVEGVAQSRNPGKEITLMKNRIGAMIGS